MQFVIQLMDIPSLTRLHSVSKRAMDVVNETLEYKRIMKQAPQV
jgi:hypothetical protein